MKLPELTPDEVKRVAESAKPHLDAVFSMLETGHAFDVAAIGILLRQASAALHKGLLIGQLVPDRDSGISREGVIMAMVPALGQVGAVIKLAGMIRRGEVEDNDDLDKSMVRYLVSAMFDIDQVLCYDTFRGDLMFKGVYHDPSAE